MYVKFFLVWLDTTKNNKEKEISKLTGTVWAGLLVMLQKLLLPAVQGVGGLRTMRITAPVEFTPEGPS